MRFSKIKCLLLTMGLGIAGAISAAPANFNSTIESAQSLALKKNRKAAAALLEKALASSGPSTTANSKKITEALHQVGRVFFTDKGQRLFESGQSILFENPDLAMTQFKEALTFEDDNVVILSALAEAQLVKADCAGSAATLLRAKAIDAHVPLLDLLDLRTLLCAQDYVKFNERVKNLNFTDPAYANYSLYMQAQVDLLNGEIDQALVNFLKVTREWPKFPEAYYGLYRANVENEMPDMAIAQKYISLCKSMAPKDRKNYPFEPKLCASLKEVEDEVAKKTNDQQ